MQAETYAALYDLAMWPLERFYVRRLRRQLLAQAHGRVLEIGAGTGANLAYYPGAARPVLSEADWGMLQRIGRHPHGLHRNAGLKPGHTLTVAQAPAEQLPFLDRTFDCAVATLVLCSVSDQPRAVAELRRVLRPGGSLLLLEHVRSEHAAVARLQSRLTPAWGKIVRGCHLDRDTAATVSAGGFRIDTQKRLVPVPILPLVLIRAIPE